RNSLTSPRTSRRYPTCSGSLLDAIVTDHRISDSAHRLQFIRSETVALDSASFGPLRPHALDRDFLRIDATFARGQSTERCYRWTNVAAVAVLLAFSANPARDYQLVAKNAHFPHR